MTPRSAAGGSEPDALACETPEAGCCGMAGSFGFNPAHYELSMKLGERAPLPAVRRALHIARVARLALTRES